MELEVIAMTHLPFESSRREFSGVFIEGSLPYLKSVCLVYSLRNRNPDTLTSLLAEGEMQ